MIKYMTFAAMSAHMTQALDNGLGAVPPMGWSTWDQFMWTIHEDIVKENADAIVELGLDKLGYRYVNIDDDSVSNERDADGHLQPLDTFPSGFKEIGKYIHSKGLLYGVYSSAGKYTCESKAASLGMEDIDAQDYADWEVDYLKYDNCPPWQDIPAPDRFRPMAEALNRTGRPIYYAVVNWGEEHTVKWAPEIGNSFRTHSDICATFPSLMQNYEFNYRVRRATGPGHWADPDNLLIGLTKDMGGSDNHIFTIDEEKTQMALWAVAKAPLFTGADLRRIRPESLAILKNKELIDANQDPGSIAGEMFAAEWLVGIEGQYVTNIQDGIKDLFATKWTPGFVMSQVNVLKSANLAKTWGRVATMVMTLSNGDKLVVSANISPFTWDTYQWTLQDLDITLQEGQKAVLTDVYDPDFKHEISDDMEKFYVGSLRTHACRALKMRFVKEGNEILQS